MKIEIDHIGIAVESLESSLAFYCNVLGFELARRETVAGEQVEVAMLPVAAPHARIELLEATAPDSAIARSIAKRGAGLHHIALRVDDLQRAVARLELAGCKLIGESKLGAGGHRYVFVHPGATRGVLLELVEDPQDHG